MNGKLYIKKFIRDDGGTLSFDAEEIYLSENNTLLVRSDPATTAVEFTEEDGGEMIRQRGATYSQPVSGLIVPKSTEYWALCVRLSRFFILNHTYKIVYIKRDGSMFSMNRAWINAGLQIVPVPYENYSTWTIEFRIGDNFWTEYAEDSQGKEIYSNSVELPLLTAGTGGEVWSDATQQTLSGLGNYFAIDGTSISASINELELRGDTYQQTAPNPDYPQDVQVVTGEQTVAITGKNILDSLHGYVNGYINASGGVSGGGGANALFDYIAVSPSSNYTLSQRGANVTNAGIAYFDANKTFISREQTYDLSSKTYSTPEGCSYVRIWVYKGEGISQAIIEQAKLQFEKGSATDYEPYQSQSYTISLGSIELCKIGDYQDYIYKSGDDWYTHKDIGKVDIVSSGIAAFNTHSGSHITVNYSDANVERLSAPAVTNASNRFIGCTSTQTWGGTVLNGVSQGTNSNYLQFSLSSSVATTQAEVRTYFANHPTTVYYTLATATDTKITDATLVVQLNALAEAQAYSGKTVYHTNSSMVPAILSVELLQSVGGGEIWDNVGAVWEEGVGGVQTINVETTQTTYPVWTVTGPCSNPTLQNDTTDTIASFDGMIASGQTLTVNFADNTAYLDSAPVAKYVSGYVSLAPGENVIGFNSDGGSTQTSTISWDNIIN